MTASFAGRPLGVRVRCVLDARALVGESPLWCAERQALYWVDIRGQALHRFDPMSGEDEVWPLPERIGCVALRRSGGAILAMRTGLYAFDLETARIDFLIDPEPDRPSNRFNDGKVSPEGRLWVGTMDDRAEKSPVAALYRLDPDGTCRRMVEGLVCSNGLAWSPGGSTMYLSDSRLEFIDAFDYDLDTGGVTNRRRLVRPSREIGRPDGAAVDVEGFYWSCGVEAWRINRFAPDGQLDCWIAMPTASPTMCCFGGADLRTLYVTTKQYGESPGNLRASANPGGLFAIDVGIAGVEVPKFAG